MTTLAPDFKNIADSLLEQIKTFDRKVEARSVGNVVSVGDGVAFVNAFLKKVEADGTWAKLWTISIGQRTGSTAVPTPPALP